MGINLHLLLDLKRFYNYFYFLPLLPFTLLSYVEKHHYTNNSAGSCTTRSLDKLGMFLKI